MHSPLKFQIYEYLKEVKHATDEELLEFLNKNENCSKNELNKALMQLEILGLINTRWIAKEKRRVEFVETPVPESSAATTLG